MGISSHQNLLLDFPMSPDPHRLQLLPNVMSINQVKSFEYAIIQLALKTFYASWIVGACTSPAHRWTSHRKTKGSQSSGCTISPKPPCPGERRHASRQVEYWAKRRIVLAWRWSKSGIGERTSGRSLPAFIPFRSNGPMSRQIAHRSTTNT